ncbi:MAG: hypothetical protein RMM08_00905 [Armatimonadota bacterium]|nr:hypothetical protein [Armatimonadota bacterium]
MLQGGHYTFTAGHVRAGVLQDEAKNLVGSIQGDASPLAQHDRQMALEGRAPSRPEDVRSMGVSPMNHAQDARATGGVRSVATA